ncbi:hypothetical protein AY599_23615 [Leptolyngbya valderiana BDU 20041]|nr:hypothetical protein AY599_23615 [Leptolyngbya valderiana BDU 20041]
MSWSDADYAEAKRLWAAGESAAQIAAVVGRSRNAVCGMVHRNPADFAKRRTRRAAPKRSNPAPAPKRAGARPPAATPPARRAAPGSRSGAGDLPDKSDVRKPTRSRRKSDQNAERPFPLRDDGLPLRAAPVAFEDVPAGRCRWPVDLGLDAPGGPAMVVCGAPVSHAGSQRSMARTHCPAHLAKAGQSPVRRGG